MTPSTRTNVRKTHVQRGNVRRTNGGRTTVRGGNVRGTAVQRATLVLLLGLLCVLCPGGGVHGQGTLLEARVEVDLPLSQTAIPVHSVFTLRPDRGTREIPISLLSPEPIRLVSLAAYLDGRPLEASDRTAGSVEENSVFFLEKVREHYWEGSVGLPSGALPSVGLPSVGLPSGTTVPRDSITLQISYLVEGGWDEDGRATIPLVVPRWVPFEPLPETFTARIAVPEGLTVSSSFPTSVTRKPRPGSEGNYELGLQGVPAMLILRTEPGSGSFLTVERILDLVVILILLVMGAAGLRYLRGKEE